MTTQIIPEYVGYYWEQQDDQSWIMRWSPVTGYYSPPQLDKTLNMSIMQVPEDMTDRIGLVIGKNGYFFKYITLWSGAVYIFYRNETNTIEIWGTPKSIEKAYQLFGLHFQDIRAINNK